MREAAARIWCPGYGADCVVVGEAAERAAPCYAVLPTFTPTGETIFAGVADRAKEEPAGIYQGTSPSAAAVFSETGESWYGKQQLNLCKWSLWMTLMNF